MSKKRVSRTLTGLLAGLVAVSCMGLSALAAAPESITIGIYSTTDMHGRCYGTDPLTDGSVNNSYLKVATAVKEERAKVDGSVLVDCGDIIQGSAITSYNVNMKEGEENPMAYCLRYIGYDAFVLGNHEFNYSSEIQTKFYDLLQSTDASVAGSPVSVVCANLIYTDTQQPKFKPYITKEFTVGGKTFTIGVLGFENVNVPNWDVPEHYAGLQFTHDGNTDRTYVYEWVNYWQQEMRETAKCDFVIVAAHSGEGGDAVGDGADGAKGSMEGFTAENQMRYFIENTTGVDMVMSGHNHTPGIYSIQNAAGREIPCVNGGCNTLTATTLTLRSDGTLSLGESSALNLKDYEDDAGLSALIKPYYDETVPFVNQQIGTLSGKWDDVSDYYYTQGDTYDLVQKAQIWATGADVSITTPVPQKGFTLSSLFAEGAETAAVSLKNCYAFYKYDNNLLYMIEMTGKQLKDWLEQSASTYQIGEDGSLTGAGFGTDIAYGISYDVYVGNPAGSRVQNITYKGAPLSDDAVLKVALSSYRLSATPGADSYGWYAATGINTGSDKVLFNASVSEQFGGVGGSVPLIIGEYIKSETAAGRDITPGRDTEFHVYATASDAMTRLQFVEKLYEAAGSPAVEGPVPMFSDLTGNTAANWAAISGIIDGNGKGAFLPGEPVTREQAAVMLLNYAKSVEKGPVGAWAVQLSYADAADIHGWAAEGAMWNLISKLIPVGEDNRFNPNGTLSSADAQAMLDAFTAL